MPIYTNIVQPGIAMEQVNVLVKPAVSVEADSHLSFSKLNMNSSGAKRNEQNEIFKSSHTVHIGNTE